MPLILLTRWFFLAQVRYDENLPSFLKILGDLVEKEQEFVLAVVVSVKGSATAKVGAKGVILPDGRVLGWLGGWCSENAITLAALEVLKTGSPKLLKLVMAGEELKRIDENVIEVGTPCGGEVLLYMEPVYPRPQIIIVGHNEVSKALARLGKFMGYKVTVVDRAADVREYPEADKVLTSIKELDNARIDRHTYAVIATMGRTEVDVEAIDYLARKSPARIYLVASVNRAQEVFRRLARKGHKISDLKAKVEAPAGIHIGAITPEELALSLVAGIVAHRRGGKGRFMVEVKGSPYDKLEQLVAKGE
ncbi:MAG: XdhC family protein [Desulfurococcales archaeon]|nr:XdhC family protein [Desulfurococcales archaeon]